MLNADAWLDQNAQLIAESRVRETETDIFGEEETQDNSRVLKYQPGIKVTFHNMSECMKAFPKLVNAK